MHIPLPHPDYEWQPISRPALYAWLVVYAIYLVHASRAIDFTLVYPVELILHEAGHLLFSYFGQTLALWGGTIFQLLVPAMLALSFAWRGHTTGVVFCAFFFFENLLGISVYMADAREMDLPLITVGDAGGDGVAHDWWNILTQLGLLQYDTRIAAVVRAIGWLGMMATLGWMIYMARKLELEEKFARPAQAGR
jgi:hypothetical protein